MAVLFSDFEARLEATHDRDAADAHRMDMLEDDEGEERVDDAARTSAPRTEASPATSPTIPPSASDQHVEPPPSDDTLMDPLHNASFDGGEFVLQLLIHVFYPLSLICYPRSRWPQGAINQRLLSLEQRELRWHMMPAWCWLLLCVYLSRPHEFARASVSINELFTVPFLLGVSRIVLIGLKYATLTPAERTKYFEESDSERVERWLSQSQLISGWLSQRDDVISSELRGAAVRLSLSLQDMYFVVEAYEGGCSETREASVLAWERLVRSGSRYGDNLRQLETQLSVIVPGEQRRMIRCDRIIEVLLRAARAKAPVISSRLALCTGFLIAVLPRIVAVVTERRWSAAVGGNVVVALSILLSIYTTTMVTTIFLVFLSVDLAHYYRMAVMNRWLTMLIRVSFKVHPHFPQIQLCSNSRYGSHNTLAWLHCRSLLCYFGKRYEARLDAHMVMMAFLAAVAVFVPALRLLQAGGFGGVSDEDSIQSQVENERAKPFTWTALLIFTITMTVLTATVLFAADGNSQFDAALSALSQHRIKLRTALTDHDGSGRNRKRSADGKDDSTYDFEDTLQVAKEELELLNRVHVLRVAGQPADRAMALSIATTSITVVAYILAALLEFFLA